MSTSGAPMRSTAVPRLRLEYVPQLDTATVNQGDLSLWDDDIVDAAWNKIHRDIRPENILVRGAQIGDGNAQTGVYQMKTSAPDADVGEFLRKIKSWSGRDAFAAISAVRQGATRGWRTKIELGPGLIDVVPALSFGGASTESSSATALTWVGFSWLADLGKPVAPGLYDSPFYKATGVELAVAKFVTHGPPPSLNWAPAWLPWWAEHQPSEPTDVGELQARVEQLQRVMTALARAFVRRLRIILDRKARRQRLSFFDTPKISGIDHSTESHRSRAPGRVWKTSSVTVFRELAPI